MILVLAVSGCSPQWNESDVEGEWEHVAAEGTARLVLNEDGSAEAENIPVDALLPAEKMPDEVDWTDVVSGSGTWEVESGAVSFSIQTGEQAGIGSHLYVDGSGEDLHLYAVLNSQDIGFFDYFRAE